MKIQVSLVVTAIILLLLQETLTQDDFFQRPKGTSGETFSLDQPSSCRSDTSYSVTGKTTIIGRSSTSESSIPSECTITLSSFAQKPMKFELQISAMKLNCDLKFYIYDGDSASTLLKSYDCHKKNDNAFDPIYTTGSKVSFKLIRERIDINANYEIRIIAEVVKDIIISGGGWNPRLDRDERDVRKFDTDIIIILMSVAFLLAFLIYGIVLAVYWKRRNKGGEKWTERQMGYDNAGQSQTNSQTLAYVEQMKIHPPDDPRGQPMTTFSKTNGQQRHNYQTRMAQSSIDADSVFEGEKGEKIRRRLESNNGREVYHNAAYQHTPQRPRARSSHRNTSSSYPNKKSNSPSSSDVPSMAREDRKWQPKPKRMVDPEPIPSDSEDEVERASIGLNTDPELTDQGVQCEVEEPEKPQSLPSTTTTSVGVGSSPVLRHSPQPRRNYRPPSYEEALSETEYPSVSPKPRSSPRPPNQPGVPYIHYSNPTLRRPQPVYSQNQGKRPYTPDYQHPDPHPKMGSEGSIPVYSYLVNRGYHIDDGQSSCGGTSHDSRIDNSNDSDLTANLDCGVELMRR